MMNLVDDTSILRQDSRRLNNDQSQAYQVICADGSEAGRDLSKEEIN